MLEARTLRGCLCENQPGRVELTRRIHCFCIASVAALALFIAGCGDDDTKTVTETPSTDTGTTTSSDTTTATTTTEASTDAGNSDLIKGIDPPSGSKEISSSDKGGVYYAKYSTSDTPARVISVYSNQLNNDGWKTVNEGGSGGGWGPYGGSSSGLTAKKSGNYFDVQAGGEKGHTTYFEICAGPGTREECDNESDNSDSNSGGSGNSDDNNQSNSSAS